MAKDGVILYSCDSQCEVFYRNAQKEGRVQGTSWSVVENEIEGKNYERKVNPIYLQTERAFVVASNQNH